MKFDSKHIPISEDSAIDKFHPENIKLEQSSKISKTQISKTRWEVRDPLAQLCVILSEKYEDLCWWNGSCWTYITTNLR